MTELRTERPLLRQWRDSDLDPDGRLGSDRGRAAVHRGSRPAGGWPARPWGHGFATEAARAALAYGFDTLELPEILAITAAANVCSQAVMRRLGMTHDPAENFGDPRRSARIAAAPCAVSDPGAEWTQRPIAEEYSMTAFDRIKAKAEELAKKAKPRAEELAKKAKPKVEELREKAGPMAQSLREKAEKAGETLKSKAEDVAEGLRQGTSEANTESKQAPAESPQQRAKPAEPPAAPPQAGEKPPTAEGKSE